MTHTHSYDLKRIADGKTLDELAAQNVVMRGKINSALNAHPKAVRFLLQEAIYLPTIAEKILRKRDATLLRSVLSACSNDPAENYSITVRKMIEELEAGK